MIFLDNLRELLPTREVFYHIATTYKNHTGYTVFESNAASLATNVFVEQNSFLKTAGNCICLANRFFYGCESSMACVYFAADRIFADSAFNILDVCLPNTTRVEKCIAVVEKCTMQVIEKTDLGQGLGVVVGTIIGLGIPLLGAYRQYCQVKAKAFKSLL